MLIAPNRARSTSALTVATAIGFAGGILADGTKLAPGSSLTAADAECRDWENFWKARTRKSGVADS
jgi:hypothetical protein